MCGIAAIFAYAADAPPVDERELLTVRDAMISRGPDGAGLWISKERRTGLAHRRLAIIDLSPAGAQPMSSEDGRLHVVFNGEIYNYPQIRARLESSGVRFRSNSDTEVLLHLYREKGADLVRELRGMFAFALWDESHRRMVLARDPFGIKPLYYADDGRTLRVASQVKALLRGGAVDTRPNPAGHAGFFLLGSVPDPHTLYRGVSALPAGAVLTVEQSGRVSTSRYCVIEERIAAAADLSVGDAPEKLRAALLDSVKHHFLADVPVAVFLSAGLDSGTLTGLSAELQPKSLRTFTLGFEQFRGTPDDEVPLAEHVAKHYETVHETRWISREEFEGDLERILSAMDQPTVDGVNTYLVSRAAAKAGIKVALSGVGGDELFAGYASFRQVPQAVRMFWPFRLIPGVGRLIRWISGPLVSRVASPKYASLAEYGGRTAGAYLLRRGMLMPWELRRVMDPELAREGLEMLEPLASLDRSLVGVRGARLKVTALELCWYMRNQLLRDADWAGMAHSLEIRVPLVDIVLLESLLPLLASATPPGKRDMANTPRRQLPPAVLDRPKTGFSVPMRAWLLGDSAPAGTESISRAWASRVYRSFAG